VRTCESLSDPLADASTVRGYILLRMGNTMRKTGIVLLLLLATSGCGTLHNAVQGTFRDPNMDFGQLQTVAVMPFANLSRDTNAADRVRDVFVTLLLATHGVYAVPPGEVARGISRVGIASPTSPTSEEIQKFAAIVKVDAIITGTVREYGEVRSGTTASNLISVSLQMIEGQTGRVVWSASSTQGGVSTTDRLFGGGGEPMNIVTEKAVNDLLDKLFGK